MFTVELIYPRLNALNMSGKNSKAGRSVSEHIIRTGQEGVELNITIDVKNKFCYFDNDATIGDLVEILETVVGQEWVEYELRRTMIPGIRWTTNIAN